MRYFSGLMPFNKKMSVVTTIYDPHNQLVTLKSIKIILIFIKMFICWFQVKYIRILCDTITKLIAKSNNRISWKIFVQK